ncbi:MAG: hypothetical protein ACK5AY_10225, partial [Bacteroidota bacterium]
GAVVAQGGPGTNNGTINVAVGPLNPNTTGTIFTLNVFDSFGDGFNGNGGTISVTQNAGTIAGPITGNFGAQANSIFGANVNISPVTVTIQTPSGPITSVVSNCQNINVPITLQNNNLCNPIVVNLPWTITCNSTGALLASGTFPLTVYPKVPTSANDLVSIAWNPGNCSWNVTPQNGCTTANIGSIFSISPNPTSTSPPACGGGTQTFQVTYNGIAGGPNCCSTGGPLVPVSYNFVDNTPTTVSSPFGGTNNAAIVTIPASNIGGNATSVSLTVSMSGYCFNQPGANTPGATSYWVTIYHNGTIVLDQQSTNPGPANYNTTLNLASIPGYNQNSVITVYIYPNTFSNASGNTTFSPTASCPNPNDGVWTAGTISASLSANYTNLTTSPAICTFTTSASYQCCSPVTTPNQSATICSGQAFPNLATWQSTVNASSTCVVYSSVTPVAGTTLPNNTLPNGINTTQSQIVQSVSAYAYCDANGSGTVNSGDTYTLLSTYSLTVNPLPAPTASNTGSYCPGQTISLSATGGGTYSWSGPNSFSSSSQNPAIPSATTGMSGTYTVTVTTANGCTATATTSVTVNPSPVATATNTGAYCPGQTISLSATGGGTYSWSGPNSFTSANQNPTIPSATTGMGGTYTVTVTLNTCTATATTSVTVNPSPVATATNTGAYCPGQTISLSATGGGTYSWSGPNNFSSNVQSPTIISATSIMGGVYTVTVTTNGCTTTATTSVTLNPNPLITATNTGPYCPGVAAQLNASGGGTYSWSGPNGFTSTLQNPPLGNAVSGISGIYNLTLTLNSCTATASTSVTVNSSLTPGLSSNSPVCIGSALNLVCSNGISWNWTGPGGFSSNLQNPIIGSVTATNSGTYSVTVTDALGCTGSGTINVVVNPLPTATANNSGPYCE